MCGQTLSRFVIDADSSYGTILFNTYRSSVVILDKDKVVGRELINLDDDENKWLTENDYFVEDHIILDKLKNARENNYRLLDITVSFTQNCNFLCTYCSQMDSKDVDRISNDVLDWTVKYIKKCIDEKGYERVGINLFGGEPLLYKDSIYYFKDKLESVVDPDIISYGIGTNGSLLDPDFLSHFKKIGLCVPVTDKQDHDLNRPFCNKKGSYDSIINNLVECRDFFGEDIRLGIRYNVGENYKNFGSFLDELRNLNINIQYIDVAYTQELPYTTYKNSMSKKEYSDWYTSTCIDELISHGFKVRFVYPHIFPCKAYSKYSVKVYSDGKISACNGHHYNLRRDSIEDVTKDIELTSEVLSDVKNAEYIDDECKACKYLLICGGKILCRSDDYCAFLDYSVEDFLRKYIDCVKKGQGSYFDI